MLECTEPSADCFLCAVGLLPKLSGSKSQSVLQAWPNVYACLPDCCRCSVLHRPVLPLPSYWCVQIVRMLERINIYDVLPRKWVFVHTHDGVRAALAALEVGADGKGPDVPSLHSKDVDHVA